MNILAVGAHPDDIEIACSGTLAKYARQGHHVSIIHVCNGDKGDFVTPPDQLAHIRTAESAAAGGLIGVKTECLNFPDAGIFYSEETLGIFVDHMRPYAPDVLITHAPNDYHLDHIAVSKLVTDASFLLSVPSYRPQTAFADVLPQIYYMEPYNGFDFAPTDYVDITETMSIKLEMMRCHESQIVWMKEHDHVDILDYLNTVAKFRGYQCGVPYAEAFVRKLTALRATPGVFLP